MAQQKQKETYNRKHLHEELTLHGTEVLIENTAQKGKKVENWMIHLTDLILYS